LRAARRSLDTLIARYIARLGEDDLNRTIRYLTFVKPQTIEQALSPALDHFSTTRPITAARPMPCSPA